MSSPKPTKPQIIAHPRPDSMIGAVSVAVVSSQFTMGKAKNGLGAAMTSHSLSWALASAPPIAATTQGPAEIKKRMADAMSRDTHGELLRARNHAVSPV